VRGLHRRLHFGDEPKLRHRKGPELDFKPDHAFRGRLAAHDAWTLVIRHGRCYAAKHPKKDLAGSDGWIGHNHIRRFLRIPREMEVTATFKHKKSDLARAGYDPALTDDAIYFNDAGCGAFARLDKTLYGRIQGGGMRL
jgi:hypothetical protein